MNNSFEIPNKAHLTRNDFSKIVTLLKINDFKINDIFWDDCRWGPGVLASSTAPFFARSPSLEELTSKFSEAKEALRERFLARARPLGLDFGSPGRSWEWFWRPKHLVF